MADLSQIPTEQLVQMLQTHPAVTGQQPAQQPTFMQKVGDEFEGARQSLYDIPQSVAEIGARGTDAIGLTKDGYKTLHDAFQMGNTDAARDTNSGFYKGGRIAGNIATTLPLSELKIAQMAGKLPMLARVADGAVQGAAAAGLTSNSSDAPLAKQVELGGALGGALPLVTRAASLAIAPRVSAAAKSLMDAGIPLTPGMMFGGMIKAGEDKLSSLPILGDLIKNGQRNSVMGLNTAVLSQALKPIGQALPKSLSAGREAVDYVASRISDRYNNLLPKLTGALDHQLQQDITAVATSAVGDGAKQETLDRFKNIIKSQIVDRAQNGALTGDALKSAQQNLGNLARKYGASQNADDQALGDMVSEAQQHFNDMLERVNPGFQGQLRDVNKAFAQYSRIRRAAGSLGNKDGVFSPPQLANAVKAGDSSAGKGNFARGKAFGQDISDPANQIMPSTVPDSGTPGRLMMAALLGGHAAVNPAVGTAGILASLLYTKAGQRALGAYAKPGLVRSGVGVALQRPAGLLSPTAGLLAPKLAN